jgi:hypothetical protein
MLPFLASAVLAAGPGVAWTRDYTKAFTRAEEERRPLLLFFRNNCGGGNVPTNPVAVGGPIEHQEGLSQCDRMQDDVWENSAVVPLTDRFLPVVLDGGDATLEVRYQAVRTPTTLIVDPWGNEIFRVSGYLDREKMARVLQAIPRDFSGLAIAGRVLKDNPTDFGALVAAAQFYDAAGLAQVTERLYESALAAPGASDVAARRQAVIARGLNLMARLNRAGDAAVLFEKEIAAAPDGPGTDALMLGLVNARLSQGHHAEAEVTAKQMQQRFAGSPYTARAKQLVAK